MKFKFGVAALAAAALGAAGCGDSNTTSNSSSTDSASTSHAAMSMESTASSGKGGVDSGASSLRAALTAGLQEHVYLAGIAVENGVNHGLDSGEFKAAASTLDKNSVALSQAIEGVYGQEAGTQFLKVWRQHI